MDEPAEPPVPPPDAALARALDGLVADGVLTADQAQQVAQARQDEVSLAALAHPGAPPPSAPGTVQELSRSRPGAASRLPEVLGYLGGTFVVAAVLLVVGWSWESFSQAAKLTIAVLAALVVYGAGLAIALGAAGGRRTLLAPAQDVRRRLVGVLLVVGAFIAAGAVEIALDDSADAQLLPVALTAAVLTALAVHLAPGAAPTLGLFAATVMLAATPEELRGDVPDLAWILIFLGLGVLWVAAGPVLTRTPVAALVVGLGDLVVVGWVASEHTVYEADAYIGSQQQWGDRVVAPLGYAVLAMLTILGVALYLRGRDWPWLAAATVSAAVLVFQMAGDAFGPAVASLVVGSLLLAASGLLIVRRGRADAEQVRAPGP